MLAFLHHQNLVYDELFTRLMRKVHFFDGDLAASGKGFGDVDVAGGAALGSTARKRNEGNRSTGE